jgi:hypothetical protein
MLKFNFLSCYSFRAICTHTEGPDYLLWHENPAHLSGLSSILPGQINHYETNSD